MFSRFAHSDLCLIHHVIERSIAGNTYSDNQYAMAIAVFCPANDPADDFYQQITNHGNPNLRFFISKKNIIFALKFII